jgi:uncharacterized integral membrane protein
MRKKFFLGTVIFLIVFMLIFAFENILYEAEYLILFFSINTTATILILFSTLVGFLIGFFAMLYSFEVRREKELEDYTPTKSSESVTPQEVLKESEATLESPTTAPPEQTKADEDDEILG